MNIYLNHTDKYLIWVYFIFASAVGLFFEMSGDNHWIETMMNIIIFVIVSLGLFWVITSWILPKFLPDGRIAKLMFSLVVAFISFGFLELILTHYALQLSGKTSIIFQASPWKLILYSVFKSFMNVAVLLFLFTGKKYFETQLDLQNEEEKRRDIEFKILRDQMDPHFLFNNLNSVESLIEQEPKRAIQYVQKLSSLYRYFLKTNGEEVVPLNDEIEFAKNYIYLIEQRFGDLYQFSFINTTKGNNLLLLPGALQTAIENVIKHNKASSQNPIETKMEINENAIVISNGINLKTIKAGEESRIGLNNLQNRYNLLGDYQVHYTTKNEVFSLSIPLINEIKD